MLCFAIVLVNGCCKSRFSITNGCSLSNILEKILIVLSCSFSQGRLQPLASSNPGSSFRLIISSNILLRVAAAYVMYCVRICMFCVVSCFGTRSWMSKLAVRSWYSSRARVTPLPSFKALTHAPDFSRSNMFDGYDLAISAKCRSTNHWYKVAPDLTKREAIILIPATRKCQSPVRIEM